MKIKEFADKLQPQIGKWVDEDKENRQVFIMISGDVYGLNTLYGGNGVMLAAGLTAIAEENQAFHTILREVVKQLDKKQAD